jgi:hypothetical protein
LNESNNLRVTIMKNSRLLAAFYAVILLLITTTTNAALIVPPGLAPGETYQLVFVTSGITTATSADISYYNTFVQSAANAAGIGSGIGVNWSVIASTAAIDANTNAVVSGKVFNMNGVLVASSNSDFWDGTHAIGIRLDEYSIDRNFNVWTGSNTDGTRANGNALGNTTANWGESTFSNSGWTARGATATDTHNFSLYALSEPLTAPVPVPAAVWFFSSGLLGLVGIARRKKAA